MTWLDPPKDDAGKPKAATPDVDEEKQAPIAIPKPAGSAPWALILAILWAITAIIVGIAFIVGASPQTYGGDAYTGIQNAVVTAVHAIGWLIISSGVLGVVIAAKASDRS